MECSSRCRFGAIVSCMDDGVPPGADALPVPKSVSMRPSALKQLDRRRLRNARRAESWRVRLRPLPPLPLATGVAAPALLRAPPPTVTCRGFRTPTPSLFTPVQHAWTDAVPDECANPESRDTLQRQTTKADAAAPLPRVRKKRATRFDTFFADWKRRHPDWESRQDALAVAALQPQPPATPAVTAIASTNRPIGCKAVVCKGLSADTYEDDLWEFFSGQCMSLCYVKLISDKKTGASMRVAYVDFDDEADVDLALELHGSELRGKSVRIEYLCRSGSRGQPR